MVWQPILRNSKYGVWTYYACHRSDKFMQLLYKDLKTTDKEIIVTDLESGMYTLQILKMLMLRLLLIYLTLNFYKTLNYFIS